MMHFPKDLPVWRIAEILEKDPDYFSKAKPQIDHELEELKKMSFAELVQEWLILEESPNYRNEIRAARIEKLIHDSIWPPLKQASSAIE